MVYGQSRSRSVGWLCGSLIVDYIMGVEYLCTQGVHRVGCNEDYKG